MDKRTIPVYFEINDEDEYKKKIIKNKNISSKYLRTRNKQETMKEVKYAD